MNAHVSFHWLLQASSARLKHGSRLVACFLEDWGGDNTCMHCRLKTLFPSYFVPLFQNESSCKTFFHEKEFDLHENEHVDGTHFHVNGFAQRLVLTEAYPKLQKTLNENFRFVPTSRKFDNFRIF